MTEHHANARDRRVLLLAPTRKDATTTESLLRNAAIAALLQKQPPWSDVPIVVLAHAGAASSTSVTSTREPNRCTACRPTRSITVRKALQRWSTLTTSGRCSMRFGTHRTSVAVAATTSTIGSLRATANTAGSARWGRAEFARQGAARRAVRIVGASRDVTLENHAEDTLREAERRCIARDIHDHIGQQMPALRMNLETLRTQAAGRTALDHLGLSAALQNLVTGWSERFTTPADGTRRRPPRHRIGCGSRHGGLRSHPPIGAWA